MGDIYIWRQSVVCSSFLFTSVSIGFMHGFPAVLNPAITSPISTDIITTTDHASWIAAINGIGGVLGAFGHSPIMQLLGRRAAHYRSTVCLLIGWVIFPFANNIAALYAARLVQGFANGAVYINAITLGEYVHPKRRGYFISSKKVFTAIGTFACHAMGAFWTWRQIAMIASIFSIISIVLTFFWPESPSYLALKGRFTECEKSFNWLNGNSEESQKCLKALIEAQKQRIRMAKSTKNRFSNLWQTLLKKDFQKPILISFELTLALDLCGKYYFGAYIIQIMMKLLKNKTLASYFTVGADLLIILALVLLTVLIRCVKRRVILLTSGVFAVLLMLSISILVYLKTVYTFSSNFNWFTAVIINLQCFVINIGLIPLSAVIIGEIFPLEDKGVGACATTVVFTFFKAVSLKITPVLMEYTGLYGTFATYGVALALCLAILYKIVPETKDRTLQEIEDEFKCVKNNETTPTECDRLLQN